MPVQKIHSAQEFDQAIANADGKLVAVDFTATWCGPCRAIAPEFERLSDKYSDQCVFLKVDVDEIRAVAAAEGIRAMPTFKFYKYTVPPGMDSAVVQVQGTKQLYHAFCGASAGMIEQAIQQYSPDDAEPNPNAEAALGSGVGCVLL